LVATWKISGAVEAFAAQAQNSKTTMRGKPHRVGNPGIFEMMLRKVSCEAGG
jgi:hypothetical protein